jgi:hypothetical protein
MSALTDYWIKNDEWLPVQESHYQTIAASPERFGLTQAEIDAILSEHGDSSGTHGPGRDQVVHRATENGWIRVRRFRSAEKRIVVQGTNIEKHISSVQDFVAQLKQHGILAEGDSTVVLSDFATGETRSFHVGDAGVPRDVEGDLDSLS